MDGIFNHVLSTPTLDMPSKSRATAEIPVININSEGAASRLLDAAASHGFVFVENNEAGIPVKDIQDMFDLVRERGASHYRDRS